METNFNFMRILIVEDDILLSNGIATYLRNQNISVDQVFDANSAIEAVFSNQYSLLLLDLKLPEYSGVSVLKKIKEHNNPIMVIVLTALDGLNEKVICLNSGACDYLVKPVALEEIEARIKAMHRKEFFQNQMIFNFENFSYDTSSRRALIKDKVVTLTAKETQVLEIFLPRLSQVVPRTYLQDQLSTIDNEITHNSLEIIISRLRKKLEGSRASINPVRGIGYIMDIQKIKAKQSS